LVDVTELVHKNNAKQPYPDWITPTTEKFFTTKTENTLFRMAEKIDFVTEVPLKTALLSVLLKKVNLWEVGFRSSSGLWFPAKKYTYDCCRKVNAPTVNNPLGLKHHMRTEKHILNLLSTVFKLKTERIQKELPRAKMIFAMDTTLLEESIINIRCIRWSS